MKSTYQYVRIANSERIATRYLCDKSNPISPTMQASLFNKIDAGVIIPHWTIQTTSKRLYRSKNRRQPTSSNLSTESERPEFHRVSNSRTCRLHRPIMLFTESILRSMPPLVKRKKMMYKIYRWSSVRGPEQSTPSWNALSIMVIIAIILWRIVIRKISRLLRALAFLYAFASRTNCHL